MMSTNFAEIVKNVRIAADLNDDFHFNIFQEEKLKKLKKLKF